MWDLIVSVADHFLSFYFTLHSEKMAVLCWHFGRIVNIAYHVITGSVCHIWDSKTWFTDSVLTSLQNSVQFWSTSFQNGFCMFCLNWLAYPSPKEKKTFWKSIPDKAYQDIFSWFCITLLSHVILGTLIKTCIFTIRSPPAKRSLIAMLRLILSGPEFHKNL